MAETKAAGPKPKAEVGELATNDQTAAASRGMDEDSGRSLREAAAVGTDKSEHCWMKRQQMNERREWKEIHKKTKGGERCAEHRSSAGGSSLNGCPKLPCTQMHKQGLE